MPPPSCCCADTHKAIASPSQPDLVSTTIRRISMEWTGSPTKKASASFSIYDENTNDQVCFAFHLFLHILANLLLQQLGLKRTSSALPLPLTTSRFANRGPSPQARLPPANRFNPFLPSSSDASQTKSNMEIGRAHV